MAKIDEISIQELKASAYDLIAAREEATRQLQIVIQMIAQRIAKVPKVEITEKPLETPENSN